MKEDRITLSSNKFELSDKHDSPSKLRSTFNRESRFKVEKVVANDIKRSGSMVVRKERSAQFSSRTPAFGHRRSDRGS